MRTPRSRRLLDRCGGAPFFGDDVKSPTVTAATVRLPTRSLFPARGRGRGRAHPGGDPRPALAAGEDRGARPPVLEGLRALAAPLPAHRRGALRLFRRGSGEASVHAPEGSAMCGAPSGRTLAVDVDGQVQGCAVFVESYQSFPSPFLRERVAAMRMGDLRAADFPATPARVSGGGARDRHLPRQGEQALLLRPLRRLPLPRDLCDLPGVDRTHSGQQRPGPHPGLPLRLQPRGARVPGEVSGPARPARSPDRRRARLRAVGQSAAQPAGGGPPRPLDPD